MRIFSRNLALFYCAVIVVLIIGDVNKAPIMYVVGGVLASIMVIAFELSRLSLSRLQIELSAESGTQQAREAIPVTVRVRSIGNISLSRVGLELPYENLTLGVRVDDPLVVPSVLLPPLRPGAELEDKLRVCCYGRGRYRIGPARIRDCDPIGMFQSCHSPGEQIEVVVLPNLVDLPRWALSEIDLVEDGLLRSLRHQVRDEFSGIRQYNPGDDLRHVHWKVTAHTGTLVVKKYESLCHRVVSIHLDLQPENYPKVHWPKALETAVSAAASVAYAALAEQRMVALHGDGLSPALSIPARGEVHLRDIMLALAEVQANGEDSFTEALQSQLEQVPRGAFVLVLTPYPDESLAVPLGHALARGLSVRLLLVEETSVFSVIDAPSDEEKAEFIAALERAGVGVATLRRENDLPSALVASAPRRCARRRGWGN